MVMKSRVEGKKRERKRKISSLEQSGTYWGRRKDRKHITPESVEGKNTNGGVDRL